MILAPTVATHELHFLTSTKGWKDQDGTHRNKPTGNDAPLETRVEDEDAAAHSHATGGNLSAVDISSSASELHDGSTLGEAGGSIEHEAETLQLQEDDGRCNSSTAIMALHPEAALGRTAGADYVAAAGSIATAAAEMYRGQLEAISSSTAARAAVHFTPVILSLSHCFNLHRSGQSGHCHNGGCWGCASQVPAEKQIHILKTPIVALEIIGKATHVRQVAGIEHRDRWQTLEASAQVR